MCIKNKARTLVIYDLARDIYEFRDIKIIIIIGGLFIVLFTPEAEFEDFFWLFFFYF